MKKINRIITCILGFVLVFALTSCSKGESDIKGGGVPKSDKSLMVYSGAGLKKPMEEIGKEFEKENGIAINYIFAGSTQLLSQLELSGKGDAFIVGSINAYEAAKKKSLVGECKNVAYHTPVIVVKKGNPKNIKGLKDLEKQGIKVVLGDEKANAIGKTTVKIIEKNSLKNISKNVVGRMATVNEVTMHVIDGTADAAIVTRDSAFGNDKIQIVGIPATENIDQILPIGSVLSSKEMELSKKFVDYVSSNKGKSIFEKYGFKPVK
ncbi:MAG: molybdate ABC transporter substrate-binding protein [Clostridium sp.]